MTTAVKRLADADQRELIRTALRQNVIVEAAAGTGKTTALVNRIVAVLEGGSASVDSIVAVTFTEKAAGELKLRLRAGLEEARAQARPDEPRHAHLERALARLEEARVGTIHGFCADLLRERSVEAEVDPEFQTMTEPEAERLYREAFDLWLQEKLEDPPEGVRRSLRRSAAFHDEGPVGRLRQAGRTLVQWRDFPEPWQRAPFDRIARIDELVEELHAFADLSEKCGAKDRDNFYADTVQARRVSREIRTAEDVRPRDHDRVEAALIDLGGWKFERVRRGSGKAYGEGVARADVHAAHRALAARLREFATAADADLAALLQGELTETVHRYEALKRRTGRLDFVDLLLEARDLVRDHESVRADFQRRFSHVFIDEFQDTDPLQAEILLLLAADDPAVDSWRDVDAAPGKLFLVADPKQSIYRFRRADVGIYMEVKEMLAAKGALCLQLTTSFRSVPSIQRAVNAVFPSWMDGDTTAHQARYVPLTSYRDDPEGQPAVVALPVPKPYGRRNITKSAIEASLPDTVGAFVEWLVRDSGWTVTERERPAERVPVAARHVCLLFRRFDSFFAGDVTRPYVQALEARGIRHLLVGGRSFHEREEVETIRTALCAIEWPDDELSVFATLRGSFFAVGDEELLDYRHRYNRVHPFRRPDDVPDTLRAIPQALQLLAGLHRHRNSRPIAETINLLLETTRAHAGFALRPSGEQALANVLHVAEQARSYESTGGISFRGFIDRLLDEAGARKAAEAPILEEGSDGVRVMTVHRAKGLEFPVVILADMTAGIARNTAGRYIDPVRKLCAVRIAGWSPTDLLEHQDEEVKRDVAEGVRVAYVAATRARDLLVVPGLGDGPRADPRELGSNADWTSPLDGAIYPPGRDWSEAQPAPGCPAFGKETVLSRPFDLESMRDTVRPGLHTHDEHSYGVVWWDPRTLPLGASPLFGVRQEQLMSKDAEPVLVIADTKRHHDWKVGREETVKRASVSSVSVRTVTEHAHAASVADARGDGGEGDGEDPGAVELVELARDESRPSGPRFGALVHAVLATVPLDADEASLRAVAELQSRILGAPAEEAAAATRAVDRALRHALLDEARAAAARGECRRETPVTRADAEGGVVEGVVDLAYRTATGWTVIDFKTDAELEGELDAYRRQVAAYASVIAAATGEAARPVLLRV